MAEMAVEAIPLAEGAEAASGGPGLVGASKGAGPPGPRPGSGVTAGAGGPANATHGPQVPPPAPPQGQGPKRQGQGKQRQSRGASKLGKTLTGRASGGIILGEFLIGALIISSSLFTKGLNKGYLATISEITLRLSALSIVFFVLFLVAGSEKAGKAAAWFGLLVDLGIAFTATTEGQFTTLADIFSSTGTGAGTDKTILASSTTYPEPQPSVQLPDE